MFQQKRTLRVSKLTGETLGVFSSAGDAYEDACRRGWKASRRGFLNSIAKQTMGDPRKDFMYRYADEWDRSEPYAGKRNRPIFALDKKNGHLYWFPSILIASEVLGVEQVNIRFTRSKGYNLLERYSMQYQRHPGEDTHDLIFD